MITVENNVGRLIELRQTGRITLEDIQASGPAFGAILGGIEGPAVMCTDWRGMRVLPQSVADVLLNIIRSDNAKVERQGVLLDPNVILGLQLDRLLRSADKMDTATFRNGAKMQEWLGKCLNSAERVQMKQFLAADVSQAGDGRPTAPGR